MRVVDHRLREDDGSAVAFARSPNQSAGLLPEYVVIHYTAGSSAASSIAWLTDPAARASAHLVVGRDGGVTQLVPFDRRAWHAGASRWEERTGLNAWSLGIELDNGGSLLRRVDGWYSAWGERVEDSEVVEAAHKSGGDVRGWHAFSPEQLRVASEVANLLVRHYQLKDVVGHDDIAPGRKSDPGPAFPMESFRARVMGRADGEELPEARERVETTAALNIRSGPGTRFERLPASPLPAGTKLEILDARGAWRQVLVLETVNGESDVEGWVHSQYVQPV